MSPYHAYGVSDYEDDEVCSVSSTEDVEGEDLRALERWDAVASLTNFSQKVQENK